VSYAILFFRRSFKISSSVSLVVRNWTWKASWSFGALEGMVEKSVIDEW
jgi:hypothetical protein